MAQGVASTPALQQVYAEQGGPSEPKSSPRRETYRHTYGAIDLGTNNCRLLIARPTDGALPSSMRFRASSVWARGFRSAGRLRRTRWIARSGRWRCARDKLRRRNVSLSRSVATEACRRATNGAEFAERVRTRDRDRPRHHRAAGGSAPRRARLPQVARAGRRAGADLRHRRRIDRAGAGRAGRGRPAGSAPGGARPGAWSR